MYVGVGEATLADILPDLVRNVPDEKFYRVVFLAGNISKSWATIGDAAQIKVLNYIRTASDDDAYRFLPYAVQVPALRQLAHERLEKANAETLARVIRKHPSPDYVLMALTRFELASTFRDAESRCELLVLPLAEVMTANDIDRIVNAFLANLQIQFANGIPDLYIEILKKSAAISKQARPSWKRLFASLQEKKESIMHAPKLLTALSERYGFEDGGATTKKE